MQKIRNYNHGSWCEPLSGRWLDNVDPATGKVYSILPDSGTEDIDRAVDSAQKAFAAWSMLATEERSRFLHRIADDISRRKEEFAAAESKDQGKTLTQAIEKSGKRAVLLASNSLSHRHFTKEPALPEDMSFEHIYHHGQYQWDMKVLRLMREGRCQELLDIMPEFFDMTMAEAKAGALTWMLAAFKIPDYPATVHAYGTVIGTGNAVVEWDAESRVQ